jgi:C1A family cysteine protease
MTGAQLDLGPAPIGDTGSEKRYDLRDFGKLPPIRNQGRNSTCWTFPVFGSLESVLLPAERWDFSENNLRLAHGFDAGPNSGGNARMATAYLARLDGPATEKEDPFVATPVVPSGPPKLFPNKKHLTEVLYLPDRSGPLDNANIKAAVKLLGPVVTCMQWESSSYLLAWRSFYKQKANDCNHNVDIIGWDDDFSASKFATTPPGNGAFIIRNSWGTNWGEAGYGYVSYYDGMVGTDNYVFSQATNPITRGHAYQYDKLGWISSTGFNKPTAWMANVFTSKADDDLHSVSFYTASPKSSYEVHIYNKVVSHPTSGSLVGKKSGTFAIPGYHTVFLDHLGIELNAKQKFSVVVKLTTPGYDTPIPIEVPVEGFSSKATAAAGQSFVSEDGTRWTDLTTRIDRANVCIKAFSGVRDHRTSCSSHTWNGKAWTSSIKPSTTICREAKRPCDLAENCDGQSETCTTDLFQPSTRVCRQSAGACDAAEKCSGSAAACPRDAFLPATTICRAAAGECDAPESCSGTGKACPADLFKEDGTPCSDGKGTCSAGICVQSSGCSYLAPGSLRSAPGGWSGPLLVLAALVLGRRRRRARGPR